jgi:hypothetical protein
LVDVTVTEGKVDARQTRACGSRSAMAKRAVNSLLRGSSSAVERLVANRFPPATAFESLRLDPENGRFLVD